MLAQRYQEKMLKCNKNNYKSTNFTSLVNLLYIYEILMVFTITCIEGT